MARHKAKSLADLQRQKDNIQQLAFSLYGRSGGNSKAASAIQSQVRRGIDVAKRYATNIGRANNVSGTSPLGVGLSLANKKYGKGNMETLNKAMSVKYLGYNQSSNAVKAVVLG